MSGDGTAYGPDYKLARAESFKRTRGKCAFCGSADATDGHHWALVYPKPGECIADDITPLCRICHEMATTLRRFFRMGGDRYQFMSALREVIAQCDIKSESRVNPASSCITERPDSTHDLLPTWKRPRSPERRDPTEPSPMTHDSESLSAKRAFGSTRTERRQFRQERSGQ